MAHPALAVGAATAATMLGRALERRRLLQLADRARTAYPERYTAVRGCGRMHGARERGRPRRRRGDVGGSPRRRDRGAERGRGHRRGAGRPRPCAVSRRRHRRGVGGGAARDRASRRGAAATGPRVRPVDAGARRRRRWTSGAGAHPRGGREVARRPLRQQPKLARRPCVGCAGLRVRGRGPARRCRARAGDRRRPLPRRGRHGPRRLAPGRSRPGPLSSRARRSRPGRPSSLRGRRSASSGTADASHRSPTRSNESWKPRDRKAGNGEVLDPPSDAELAVLLLLPEDLSIPQIAAELFLSPNTIRTHTRAIYRKLAVNSRADAVARADALGLLAQTESSM